MALEVQDARNTELTQRRVEEARALVEEHVASVATGVSQDLSGISFSGPGAAEVSLAEVEGFGPGLREIVRNPNFNPSDLTQSTPTLETALGRTSVLNDAVEAISLALDPSAMLDRAAARKALQDALDEEGEEVLGLTPNHSIGPVVISSPLAELQYDAVKAMNTPVFSFEDAVSDKEKEEAPASFGLAA